MAETYPPSGVSRFDLQPADLAKKFAEDWATHHKNLEAVVEPFRLRAENADVQHLLFTQEYLLVRAAEPYKPQHVWAQKLGKFMLPLIGQEGPVSVYSVPGDLLSLGAIMNDAIDGNPGRIAELFGKVGGMFREIQMASETEASITSDIHLGDVVFMRGSAQPLLLPPLELKPEPAKKFAAGIEEGMRHTPVTEVQQSMLAQALAAMQDAYGNAQ